MANDRQGVNMETGQETAQYDPLAMTAEEEAQIDDLIVSIVAKPASERTAAEQAVLKQANQMEALRGRIVNYAVAYGNLEKELGRAKDAGEQQAEIIGKFHDFCDSLERAVAVADSGVLVGEAHAMLCILTDARKAAGLDSEEEDDDQ